MKQLLIISLLFITSEQKSRSYYYKEETYSIYFSTVKEYRLKLIEQQKFSFSTTIKDSRYKKNITQQYSGSYNFNKDTLLLLIEAGSLTNTSSKHVKYLSVGDSLVLIKRDFHFPVKLKKE